MRVPCVCAVALTLPFSQFISIIKNYCFVARRVSLRYNICLYYIFFQQFFWENSYILFDAVVHSHGHPWSFLPTVTWSWQGFLSDLVPTSTSLAWSLAASSPSKTMCVVLFPVSKRISILRLEKGIFVDTSVYFVAILHLFSQFLSIVLQSGGQLLNVTFSFLSAWCIRRPGCVPIRVSCRCVIDVVWLCLVCCIRLIRILMTVCSARFQLLLLEFYILEQRSQVLHWSFVELELCFHQFSVGHVLVGFGQFINNFVIPAWACAAGFNNNNNSRCLWGYENNL